MLGMATFIVRDFRLVNIVSWVLRYEDTLASDPVYHLSIVWPLLALLKPHRRGRRYVVIRAARLAAAFDSSTQGPQ